MKLNSKGQVTIAAELRHRHGFATGDEVEVIEADGVLRIIRADALSPWQRAVRRVRGVAGPGPSSDEVMAITREG